MPIRVGMVSLGCSKNLVDSERMLAKLRAHGYQLVTEPGEAEIAIVNTCGFIQSAKEEAIETILELGALKKDGTLKKIILTGCLTERYKEEAAELFTEADASETAYAEMCCAGCPVCSGRRLHQDQCAGSQCQTDP